MEWEKLTFRPYLLTWARLRVAAEARLELAGIGRLVSSWRLMVDLWAARHGWADALELGLRWATARVASTSGVGRGVGKARLRDEREEGPSTRPPRIGRHRGWPVKGGDW